VPDDLTTRLEKCYTGALYDVMYSMGIKDSVLPNTLRPLDPTKKLAGLIYTISGHCRDGLTAHETLLTWTTMLGQAPRDSVIVCQPNDSTYAHMGELSSETLTLRGIRGYVVDGGCRDTDFILRLGFPVFCRYLTPVDIVGKWIAETLGEPIRIGNVSIRTGDYLMGDRDGVVIVPQERAAEIVQKAEQVMATENLVRKAILQGVDPKEAYLKFGKF
jgi:4-hydroxy-4-methyl-2-oxoglutarate aldolase